jgi:hypothetical protein
VPEFTLAPVRAGAPQRPAVPGLTVEAVDERQELVVLVGQQVVQFMTGPRRLSRRRLARGA